MPSDDTDDIMDEPLLAGQLVFNDPRKSKTTPRRPDSTMNDTETRERCPACDYPFNHVVRNGHRNRWPGDVDFHVCTTDDSDHMWVHTRGDPDDDYWDDESDDTGLAVDRGVTEARLEFVKEDSIGQPPDGRGEPVTIWSGDTDAFEITNNRSYPVKGDECDGEDEERSVCAKRYCEAWAVDGTHCAEHARGDDAE